MLARLGGLRAAHMVCETKLEFGNEEMKVIVEIPEYDVLWPRFNCSDDFPLP